MEQQQYPKASLGGYSATPFSMPVSFICALSTSITSERTQHPVRRPAFSSKSDCVNERTGRPQSRCALDQHHVAADTSSEKFSASSLSWQNAWPEWIGHENKYAL